VNKAVTGGSKPSVDPLLSKEEWLGELLQRGGIGQWCWRPDSDRFTVTANMSGILGVDFSKESFSLAQFCDALAPQDRAAVSRAIQNARLSASDFRLECRTNEPKTHPNWLEIVGAARHRSGEKLFTVEGILIDISARIEGQIELIEVHDKYQRAISAVGMAVYELDFQSDEYFNTNLDQMEEILGAPYEGSHTQQWRQIKSLGRRFHGELAGLSLKEAIQRYQSGQASVWSSELKYQRPDGQVRWLFDVSMPVKDADGNVSGSFGIVQDITGFKRLSGVIEQVVENTASAHEDYLQRLVVALSASLGVRYAFVGQLQESGDLTVSTVAIAIDGSPAPNLEYALSGTLCEKVWEGDVCFHPSNAQEKCPNNRLLVELGIEAYLGMPLRDSEGQIIGILVVLHTAVIDEQADPVRILQLFGAHAAAALERQRNAEASRFREQFYRTLFGVLAEGILVKDQTGKIEKCNDASQRILRLSEEEILGLDVGSLPVIIFDPNESPPRSYKRLTTEEVCPGGTQSGLVCGLKHGNGDVSYVSINALPMDDVFSSDKKLVVSFSDITAIYEAEEGLKELNQSLESLVSERTRELQIANQELESFAYSVSHDLRQPLRAIDGFARILELDHKDHLQPDGIASIAKIRSASKRMAHLIDDLLRLSRLLSLELHLEPIDITVIAQEVVNSLEVTNPGRNVAVFIEPNLTAVGDSRLISVVLDNLIGNSWKFTSNRKSPAIQVGQREEVFFVQDNGEGFDMKYQDQLFKPFQRLHSPGEFEGSGIGLATVRRIVDRHGGSVWAESSPENGTTVFFTLKKH